MESVNLRQCPELGSTHSNFEQSCSILRYPVYFELLIWHAEKYDACNILTGLLCYLPSDVPLIGKQKLKKCTKFGSLTLSWQQSSLIGEASASLVTKNSVFAE